MASKNARLGAGVRELKLAQLLGCRDRTPIGQRRLDLVDLRPDPVAERFEAFTDRNDERYPVAGRRLDREREEG
jgi:hypothetical protein